MKLAPPAPTSSSSSAGASDGADDIDDDVPIHIPQSALDELDNDGAPPQQPNSTDSASAAPAATKRKPSVQDVVDATNDFEVNPPPLPFNACFLQHGQVHVQPP